MPIERAIVIRRMRQAFDKGQSATSFIQEMKTQGLSYRKTDMLSDWRSEFNLKRKAGAFASVRKDRKPTQAVIATVDYKISAEFMYKIKLRSQISPGEPITERFVNIMQDRPLSPGEVTGLAWEMLQKQSPKKVSEIIGVTPWAIIQRVM